MMTTIKEDWGGRQVVRGDGMRAVTTAATSPPMGMDRQGGDHDKGR
jgi:hypothetical protein